MSDTDTKTPLTDTKLERELAQARSENAGLRNQAEMDTIRFSEMQRAGMALEAKVASLVAAGDKLREIVWNKTYGATEINIWDAAKSGSITEAMECERRAMVAEQFSREIAELREQLATSERRWESLATVSLESMKLDEAELAELRADKARLDFMECKPWIHNCASGYEGGYARNPYWGIVYKGNYTKYGNTFRAAIDAAMEATK